MPHTPGPWTIHETDRSTLIIKDYTPHAHVGVIAKITWRMVHPASVANARLIAAAPDLLEALKEIVAISDRKHNAWDRAKAAIAKAEGR